MLALIVAGYWSFGLVGASIAPLISPILADTGMTRGEMGTILGSWQFVYLFVAIPIGMLVDRYGLRWTVLAGICLVAMSAALRATAVNYVTMLGAVMVFGLGGPFVSVGAPKLVATWFSSEEAGLALGIYSIAPPAGQMTAIASANSVLMPLTGYSWRLTLLCLAGAAACTALTWAVFAQSSPVESPPVQSPAATAPEAAPDVAYDNGPASDRAREEAAADGPAGRRSLFTSFRELLRLPIVRIVLLMAIGVFLFNHSLINWLPEILESRGMSPSVAGFWASVPTLVAIVAALVVPRLTPEHRTTAVHVAVFALWVCGALLVRFGAGVALSAGLVCIGIGLGAAVPLLVLTLLRAEGVGQARMGAAGGLFFMAGEIGGVLGPTLTGFFAQVTGGYGLGLDALVVAAALLTIAALALGVARRRAAALVAA